MAQLLQTPALPTSVPKAKAFAGQVGGIALFAIAIGLGLGLARKAGPYLSRIPVVGSLLASGPSGGSGVDEFGVMG